MKKFDVKSFAAGVVFGTVGISTAFAAGGIQSAIVSDVKVTLNGAALPLAKPLISVTMENEQNSSLYMPVDGSFENLGYAARYDSAENAVDLIPCRSGSHEVAGEVVSQGNVVLDLVNHAGQTNIARSGSFYAEDQQTLVRSITSDIKGGSADLFLFDPNGGEQRITIGAADVVKEIPLRKGTWQYNCSGMFKDGGDIKIVGTVKAAVSR